MVDTRSSADQLTPLQRALLALKEMRAKLGALERARSEPIAIIGLGCRFPGGATGPEDFWQLLSNGADAITEVPGDRWDIDQYYDPNPDISGRMCTRHGGFLERVDLFDPLFFGISPREAVSMDPQQRLLLEVSWEALERGGIAPKRLAGSRTGVFLGICTCDYGSLALMSLPPERADAYAGSGCVNSIASGRLSYVLGLQGPSISIDTACSASLVAVHLACQSLRSRESDLALAAGVNLILLPEVTMSFSRARMMAPDGRCKTFDAAADGYVRGEGCGVVVLKRLSQALADRDPVLAVIRGSAVNQDGRSAGLTAPNGRAQETVIREALANAGVEPSQVDYVEAHGTGTSLGDPIEVRALGAVLGQGRSKDRPLAVGSVKTNIGHLEAAAGVAGLIKVVLALQRGEIPPHLHFKTPNPYIAWDELPVEVPTARRPWPRGGGPRIAGVSSFGFSGTNAHVVVEEAPLPEPATPEVERLRHLLALSARTETALRELARNYERHLSASEPPDLADVCFTANAGRSHFSHRLALVAESFPDLASRLRPFASGQEVPGFLKGEAVVGAPPKLAFLFTGQGAQYLGMGRELYETQPTFRKALERCDELLRPHLAQPLLSVLYPDDGESPIDQTAYTQPALFALEYALAELWRSWGVEPSAVLGHSVGEYVAACVAGVFSLEEGLKLIAARGRLMQALPPGGEMAAVFADEGRVRAAIAPYSRQVSLAAVNGPESVVISGEGGAVREVTRRLAEAAIKSQRLTVSHAFHSPLMEPMLAEFARVAAGVRYEAPRVGLVSNLTGRLVKPGDIDAPYWVRHVLEAVQFQTGMEALKELGYTLFLELGPSPTLLGMGRRCVPEGYGVWLPTLRKGRSDWEQVLTSLGELYVRGADVDWAGFDRDYLRRKVALPTYPFQRERYWINVPTARTPRGEDKTRQVSAPGPFANWLYEVAWQEKALPAPATPGQRGRTWLLFEDAAGVGKRLRDRLTSLGEACVSVHPGPGYRALGDGGSEVHPASPGDFERLLGDLGGTGQLEVVYLWALDGLDGAAQLIAGRTAPLAGAFHLAQALARSPRPAHLCLVTRGAQAVDATAPVEPFQAPLWGLARTLAIEHPELQCRCVDLDPAGDGAEAPARELLAPDGEDQVAYRGDKCYVARLVRATAEPTDPKTPIRAEGTYLVTGGLGGLGLTVARWLVAQGARHLVLVGRRAPSEAARRVIQEIESHGASVWVRSADVARAEQVRALLAEIGASLPPLRGIVHAAGVIEEAPLLQENWEHFQRVLAPKLDGGWNLHAAAEGLDLDFFLLFSSAAALVGLGGRASYAAANAFLDALADHRRALGLPALSINWGPWADVGMGAALGEHRPRKEGAVRLIPPGEGLQAMKHLLCEPAGRARIAVFPVDWERFVGTMGSRPPLLEGLIDARANLADPVRAGLGDALRSAPPDERLGLLGSRLQEHVGQVLGLPPSRIDLREPLNGLGFDSLMSIELRNRIQADLGFELPLGRLMEWPTVGELAASLARQFEAGEAEDRAQPEPETTQEVAAERAEDLPTSLDGLSDEQVSAMLGRALAQREGRQ